MPKNIEVEIRSFISKEKYNKLKKYFDKKAKFISGPLTNMFFEIIEKQKNKLKILVGSVVTTVSDNNNYLYLPV